MKALVGPLCLAALLLGPAAAHGDPGVGEPPTAGNAGFLTALRSAGISYGDPEQAIAAGRAVCGLIDNGKPGLEILQGLLTTNPGFTLDGAAQFAAIAAGAYCPHQLAPGATTK